MNNLLNNLLKKSTIQRCWSVDESRYLEVFVDHQKFAELIVRECAELMKKESEEYHTIGSDYCDHKAEAFEEAIDLVTKHFGVKE